MSNVDMLSNVQIKTNVQISPDIKTWSKKKLKNYVDKQYWKIRNLKEDFQSYINGSKQHLSTTFKHIVAELTRIERSIENEQYELYVLLDELELRGFEYDDDEMDEIDEILETYL